MHRAIRRGVIALAGRGSEHQAAVTGAEDRGGGDRAANLLATVVEIDGGGATLAGEEGEPAGHGIQTRHRQYAAAEARVTGAGTKIRE